VFGQFNTITLSQLEVKLGGILNEFQGYKDFALWLTQGKSIIPRSLFKDQLQKSIGYSLTPFNSTPQKLLEFTNRILNSRKILFNELFNIVDFGDQGFINYKNFIEAIQHLGLELNQEELDFIVFHCFKTYQTVLKLDYRELQDKLNEKELSDIKEEIVESDSKTKQQIL